MDTEPTLHIQGQSEIAPDDNAIELVPEEFSGILFVGDPHVAATPPGHRLDDYLETVLRKLRFSLDEARRRHCAPVILGDLFHVPRNNPNHLLVALMELFRDLRPWVLVGNHDKHEARFTRDVSLAVLGAAGVVRILDRPGPAASLRVAGLRVLLGASPDWTALPREVSRGDHHTVVWVTHHDLQFPDYDNGRFPLREIPGVDFLVNGHIHTPKPPQRVGGTLWLNPGSLVRLTRSPITRSVEPGLLVWRPGVDELERLTVPHEPFDEVFPPLKEEDDGDTAGVMDESLFIKGLENLALRRTTEGVGLRAFLDANLDASDPVDQIIRQLYEEVMKDGKDT